MERKKLRLLVCALAIGLTAGLASADIETDLVGHWTLDDGSGTTAVDSSPEGNNGTLGGAGLPQWVAGTVGGGALEFTKGVESYVDCGSDPVYQITDVITLSFWLKVAQADLGTYECILRKGPYIEGVSEWSVYVHSNSGKLKFSLGEVILTDPGEGSGHYRDYFYMTTITNVADNEWHHIAAAYDGSAATFYVDGVQERYEAATGSIRADTDTNVRISGVADHPSSSYGKTFPGTIDDVRVYNRGLGADEILELFAYTGDKAVNIAPTDGAELVAVDTDLIWGPPPVFTPTKYDLLYKIGDPNFAPGAPGTMYTIEDIAYADPCSVYDMPTDFPYDTAIYWRIDSYAPSYPSDPCTGNVWSFTTAPAGPVITEDPCSLTVALGATAVFTVEDINGVNYTWEKQSGGTVGGNSPVLTLTNVQKSNEDSYRCIVQRNGTPDAQSAWAALWTKRLIARWEFEDDLTDSEADGWDGVYVNVAGEPQTAVYGSGLDGQALSLVADDLHVQITDSEDFFNFYPMGYTVNVWVKTELSGAWDAIASKQHRGDWPDFLGWVIHCNDDDKASNALRYVFGDSTGAAIVSTSTIVDNQWRMVTATYDAETGAGSIYVDGRLENQLIDTERKAPLNDQPMVIGAATAFGEFPYEGLLDKMSIYSYAISPFDVATFYTDIAGGEICVEYPTYDFDENCKVDLQDFAMFAVKWLECNLVPTCY